ncbi:hypothetical protein ACIQWR_05455 [Streptomyces sp. NPDC098789]|uniref:hypothetical protein n=1 Tax=Streptomyces sp. NPDC098789 TaxID=3366098 RepID=UPI003824C204
MGDSIPTPKDLLTGETGDDDVSNTDPIPAVEESAPVDDTPEASVGSLEADNASLRVELARMKLADRYGKDIADLIEGDTPEALEADAQRMASIRARFEPLIGTGGLDPTPTRKGFDAVGVLRSMGR